MMVCVVLLSIIIACSSFVKINAEQNNILNDCVAYINNKSGVCGQWLTGKRVNVDSMTQLEANERVIAKTFTDISFAKSVAKAMRFGADKRLSLINANSDIEMLISILIGPTFDQCKQALLKIFCFNSLPPCVPAGNASYVTTKPCREECSYVENVICKNERPLFDQLYKFGVNVRFFNCNNNFTNYKEGENTCYISERAKNVTNASRKNVASVITFPLGTTTKRPEKFLEKTPTLSNHVNFITTRLISTSSHVPNPFTTTAGHVKSSVSSTLKMTKTPVLTPTSRATESPYKSNCPLYSDVLPAGFCLHEMEGLRIYQKRDEALGKDKNVRIFYDEAVPLVANLLSKSFQSKRELLQQTLGSCFDNVKDLLSNQEYPTAEEFFYCVSTIKQFTCQTHHPLCLVSGDKHREHLSPVCRESCVQGLETICKKSVNMMRQMNAIKLACPSMLLINDRLFSVPMCSAYPSWNDSHFSICQSHSPIEEINKKHVTQNCYQGIGLMYNGTINITETGKKCIRWDQNFSMTGRPPYEHLRENYCRNIQGRGFKPWCYVSSTYDIWKWEYCAIAKCNDDSNMFPNDAGPPSLVNSTVRIHFTTWERYQLEIISSVVSGVVLTICCIIAFIVYRLRVKPSRSNETRVAYETNINTAEEMRSVLNMDMMTTSNENLST